MSLSSPSFFCAISSGTKFKRTKAGRFFPHSVTLGQVSVSVFEQGGNITFYKEYRFRQLATNKKIYNYCSPICKFPFGKELITSFLKTNFDPNPSCKSEVWKENDFATLELMRSGISSCFEVTITNNRKTHAELELLLQCSPCLHSHQILWQFITYHALLFSLCVLSPQIFELFGIQYPAHC